MDFEYDELKEAVREDFERFYQMGFHANQIYPAVLDEYKHEPPNRTEMICLHLFLALYYAEKDLDDFNIAKELQRRITGCAKSERKSALGNEYEKYAADLDKISRQWKTGRA